jgi:hypothetical protein
MSFRWPTFATKSSDSDDSEVERINNSAPVPEEREESEKELEEVELPNNTPAVEPPSAATLCFDDIQKNISSVINDLEALRDPAPAPAPDETKELKEKKTEKDQEPLITTDVPEKVEATLSERFITWVYSLKSYFCFCFNSSRV